MDILGMQRGVDQIAGAAHRAADEQEPACAVFLPHAFQQRAQIRHRRRRHPSVAAQVGGQDAQLASFERWEPAPAQVRPGVELISDRAMAVEHHHPVNAARGWTYQRPIFMGIHHAAIGQPHETV